MKNLNERREIKDEIAKLEREKNALIKGGDRQSARLIMKEIRKQKRKLKRLVSPDKPKPDKWL